MPILVPILVTGGAGLIGTAVCQALRARQLEVVCLDLDQPAAQVEWIKGDVRDAALIDQTVARCERVIHLAAIVGISEYLRDPVSVLDVGIMGTRNVLGACQRHGRPVLLASTSEIYGRAAGLLHEQSDAVLAAPSVGRYCYAASKMAAEHYAFALARAGLMVTITRYFNVYGPRLGPPGSRRVVSQFLAAIRERAPLSLVDGGAAVRSFCHVDDAARATVELALALGQDPRVAGRAFNVGRNEPVAIRELARLMIELSAHRGGVREVAGRDFFGTGFEEIPNRVPDVSALREAIGFEATIGLAEGLTRTLRECQLLAPGAEARTASPELIPMTRAIFEPGPRFHGVIGETLRSGRVTNGGPLALELERQLGQYLGAEAALVSSGSMALLLAVKALAVSGSAILPAFTYIATLSAVVHAGLEPIFCDIDRSTFTLCPRHLQSLLAQHPRVSLVVPVNVYGVPPDLDAVIGLAEAHGAQVLYDDAHGFGTEVRGERVPRLPVASCLSLHATKTLPAVEGGLVVSDDRALLGEIRRLSAHGLVAAELTASAPGYNARMDELRAAVGLESFASFAHSIGRRRDYAARLRDTLTRTGAWTVQHVPDGVTSSFQNLAARAPLSGGRGLDQLIAALRQHGVEGRRYFFPALHQLDAYRGRFELPETDRLMAENLCLPLHARMDEPTLARVEQALLRVAQAG